MTAPRMRAGTTDRQAAVDRLTRHFTEGRLNAEEFDDRVGRAYAATYLDELPELLADLPEGRSDSRRGPGSAGGPWPANSGEPWAAKPWDGPRRPPPPIFAALSVVFLLALMFTIGAVTHGFFPFPLLWLGLVALFVTRGHRRRALSGGERRGGCRQVR